jgi:hypothetical protein
MYLIETVSMRDANAIAEAHENYKDYLRTIRDEMPSDAFEFASASWHYNPEDPRCPHDSWVHTLTISEPSSGDRSEKRTVDVSLRLLGAYHDGWIDLKYLDVSNYSLQFSRPTQPPNQGHGDWLVDEVRMFEGSVIHEIVFRGGAHWMIRCQDVRYAWNDKPRLAS